MSNRRNRFSQLWLRSTTHRLARYERATNNRASSKSYTLSRDRFYSWSSWGLSRSDTTLWRVGSTPGICHVPYWRPRSTRAMLSTDRRCAGHKRSRPYTTEPTRWASHLSAWTLPRATVVQSVAKEHRGYASRHPQVASYPCSLPSSSGERQHGCVQRSG